MRPTVKILMLLVITFSIFSCKSHFNATETMNLQENRDAVYQEIISDPDNFREFIAQARQNEEAKKIMMQEHMQMMESGKMKGMMENNPEMKEKMKSHMQKMMEENPEMKEKMQQMMIEKMLQKKEGRKMLMQQIQKNEEMKKEMMQKIMENPEMRRKMQDQMKQKPEDHKNE
ncbi:hypothetical protein C7S20_15410 [Christiangramia fulva]|uniref:DUF4175 domain-containing protein n=2 Tax=Christiangramia fulva TaxID=2126553 RepID=A0A2R3Z8C8_9FLAO|nr:hypothetical protein C7S20_15410 [Christiangramia fulva]